MGNYGDIYWGLQKEHYVVLRHIYTFCLERLVCEHKLPSTDTSMNEGLIEAVHCFRLYKYSHGLQAHLPMFTGTHLHHI